MREEILSGGRKLRQMDYLQEEWKETRPAHEVLPIIIQFESKE